MSESARSLTAFKRYTTTAKCRCAHPESFEADIREVMFRYELRVPYAAMLILLGEASEEDIAFYREASAEVLVEILEIQLSD